MLNSQGPANKQTNKKGAAAAPVFNVVFWCCICLVTGEITEIKAKSADWKLQITQDKIVEVKSKSFIRVKMKGRVKQLRLIGTTWLNIEEVQGEVRQERMSAAMTTVMLRLPPQSKCC